MNSAGNILRREVLGIHLTLITDPEGDLGCFSIFQIGKMQLFVIKIRRYIKEERGIFLGNMEYHLST